MLVKLAIVLAVARVIAAQTNSSLCYSGLELSVPDRFSDDTTFLEATKLYLVLGAPLQCSGAVVRWEYCYHLISDVPEARFTPGIWRKEPGDGGLLRTVGFTSVREDFESRPVGFHCSNYTLPLNGLFSVEEGDIVGMHIPSDGIFLLTNDTLARSENITLYATLEFGGSTVNTSTVTNWPNVGPPLLRAVIDPMATPVATLPPTDFFSNKFVSYVLVPLFVLLVSSIAVCCCVTVGCVLLCIRKRRQHKKVRLQRGENREDTIEMALHKHNSSSSVVGDKTRTSLTGASTEPKPAVMNPPRPTAPKAPIKPPVAKALSSSSIAKSHHTGKPPIATPPEQEEEDLPEDSYEYLTVANRRNTETEEDVPEHEYESIKPRLHNSPDSSNQYI